MLQLVKLQWMYSSIIERQILERCLYAQVVQFTIIKEPMPIKEEPVPEETRVGNFLLSSNLCSKHPCLPTPMILCIIYGFFCQVCQKFKGIISSWFASSLHCVPIIISSWMVITQGFTGEKSRDQWEGLNC